MGGMGTHVHYLAQRLVKAGCRVLVLVFGPTGGPVVLDGRFECTEQDSMLVCSCNPPESCMARDFSQAIHYFRDYFMNAVANLLQQRGETIDLIHCHDWMSYFLGDSLRGFLRKPLVSTAHSVFLPYQWGWGSSASQHAIQIDTDMCRRSDRLITVSQSMRQGILDAYDADAGRIRVIPNGLDTEMFQPRLSTVEKAALRQKLTPGAEHVIVFAGRIMPQKGLRALLYSAERVLARVPRVTYLIVGKRNPHAATLQEHITKNGLENSIRILDMQSREELARIYEIATLAVVPSLYEPFGYAATEAMAAGVPVVASRCGGLAEIIEDRVSGVLIPVDLDRYGFYEPDTAAFAEAQVECLLNPTWARRMAEAGRRRVQQMYGIDQMIESTLSFYHEILGP
jgi:glycosyltransferase involved in cell wall biosynthesis